MGYVWIAALVLLNLYAMSRVLLRGFGAEGSLAWLLAILLLPGLGAISYLIVSGPSLKRETRRKRRQSELFRVRLQEGPGRVDELFAQASSAPRAERAAAEADAAAPAPRESRLPAGFDASLLRMTTRLTHLPPTWGNRVELFDEGAFEVIEAELLAARCSIWAEYYMIRRDSTGARFLELLALRAAEGLDVRLLYDAVGSLGIDGAGLARLREAGGRVSDFLPVNPLRKRWALHFRNHRKLIVTDGQVAFTGGMNIGNEYGGSLSLRRRRRERLESAVAPESLHFKDAHLRLEGPAVGDLALVFAEDWKFATDEELVPPGLPPPVPDNSAIVAVVPSGPDEEFNSNALLFSTGISSARRRVWLTTAYFLPSTALLSALVSAVMRGVDVRVLIPAKSDVPIVRAAARFYYGYLLRGGVRLFEYQPSPLHSKTMVVDGLWGVVGSANVDVRSFRLNFELGAAVIGKDFAQRLERQFERDLRHSTEIDAACVARYSRVQRLCDGAARLAAPLL